MTYEEATMTTVTREEARREVARNGANWKEFLEDCGDLEEYSGSTVLDWLGY